MRRSLQLTAGLVVLAVLAGGAGFYLRGTSDMALQVAQICDDIPDAETASAAMTALGWQPLDPARLDEAARTSALLHIALRAAYSKELDTESERPLFDDHHARYLEALSNPGTLSFGRSDGPAIAVLGPVKDVPATYSCDVFLSAGTDVSAFDSLMDPYLTAGYPSDLADINSMSAQQPRPGIWISDVVIIKDSDAFIALYGATPPLSVLTRIAYRGEITQ